MIIILFLSLLIFFNFQSSPIITTQAASGTFTEDFTATTYMDGAQTNVSGWGNGAIENYRKKPTIVGSINSSLIGNVIDVFIDGDYAYVTNQGEGLKVVNITDPTNPYVIGTYVTDSSAQSVYIDGDYAFIADYKGVFPDYENFLILDVTNPTNPTHLGSYSTIDFPEDAARDVIVDGDTAFVANNQGGLCVVDVTDPTNPSPLGVTDTLGTSVNLAIDGDYVFLADGLNGLVVIDISDPTTPTNVTTYSTGISSATNIVVEGNYAYVVDLNNGIIVVNITDPTAPTYAGSWSKSGVSDAYIYGDYLYVTDINNGLSVVDISDPTASLFIHSISLPEDAQAIVIEGCYAYIACLAGGFQVVRIADISDPIFTSSHPSVGARDVFIDGDYAFVADFSNNSLQVVDVSDPSSPNLMGFYKTPATPSNIYVSGDYAYISDWDVGGLQIINISDPSSPTYVSFYDTPSYALGVFVSGDYAYVADSFSGLQIIDISDPTSPTCTGSYNTPGEAYDVVVSGDYAYVADFLSGLQVINISNPYSPTYAGSYDTPDKAYGLSISGDYVYVADYYSGLQVLNISDPSSPTYASSYDTLGCALGVFISGDFAYVADYESGLQVLDISDPSTPVNVSFYNTPGGSYDVDVSGDYAYIADFEGGLQILEVRKNKARQFDSPCIAQSNTVFSASSSNIVSTKLVANDITPVSTSITYSLSADGGNNWETITPGLKHVFLNIGNQLKWKAVLSTSDVSVTPKIHNISIAYETILDSPVLFNPLDGAITDDYTPSFTWNAISGATEYLFQLDTSSSFVAPIINITIPSPTVSYTVESPLSVNTHYWRVAAIDSEGDLGVFSSYRTLNIIQDTNTPTINHPNDISFGLGTTGNSITWIPTDSNPYWYNITLNGFLSSHDDPWLGGSIVMNIDGLALGTYTVVCSVYDLEGLMISDAVNIDVVSTAPPTIDDVTDFDYEEGTTGHDITWHPSDTNPDWYTITREGTIIDEGVWTGGDLTINIDGLAYGVYTYVCTVNDTEGQEASDTVIVTVSDNTIPILSSPADIIYAEGDTGNNIIWVATDTNPETFIVYKDGALYETDTWTSGSSIIISIDGLSAGQYNFTIVVFDLAGNTAKNSVMVGVTPAAPEFSQSLFFAIISITVVFVFYYIKRRTHKKN